MVPPGMTAVSVLLLLPFLFTAHAADYHVTKLEDVVWKETIPGQTLGKLQHSKPPVHETPSNQAYRIAQRTPSQLLDSTCLLES